MNGKQLFEAIGQVGDDLIEEALGAERKRRSVGRILALAACGCLVVGGVLLAVRGGLLSGVNPADGATPGGTAAGSTAADGASGSGHEAGSTFLSYAGPVFPLTLETENAAISAARALTLDFAGFAPREQTTTMADGSTGTDTIYPTECFVTDAYTLTNDSVEPQTVTVVYPFTGSLLERTVPELTVDGQAVSTELHQGAYSGGFSGASEEEWESGSWNLRKPTSWTDDQTFLGGGSDQAEAFADDPVLSEPVTVYTLSDETIPAEAGRAATVAISFTIDPEKTTVLSYDFNGSSWEAETGSASYSYFVGEWDNEARPRVLAVLGEDLNGYEVAGYADGSCEEAARLDGLSATVTCTETTLGELLGMLCDSYVAMADQMYGSEAGCTGAQLARAAAEMLTEYGPLSEQSVQRYRDGRLDDLIFDALVADRVFYLAAEITIPAGASVTVSASLAKQASFDFACTGEENMGVLGYDLVTQLGSCLHFIQQTATIVPRGRIEIVRQNFGFDLDAGVTSVTLDPAQEHYELEVRVRDVEYEGTVYSTRTLSQETVDWIDWYNGLSGAEQSAVSAVPPELTAGAALTADAG